MESTNKITALLSNLGIRTLNTMQSTAYNVITDKANTILLSPTGSGKTLAFLLPLSSLLSKDIRSVQCLIIVPFRELALQIEQVWKKMNTGFKVNVCYGGHAIDTEIKNLSNPPALLIGTPGRINDHLERQSFDTCQVHTLVLDEFDKSLQLGFLDEMSTILGQLHFLKKRVLLSATSGVEIPDFIKMESPAVLDFTKDKKEGSLSVKLVISEEKDKIEILYRLICSLNSEPALIFCNHREAAERISSLLNKKGLYTGHYHGGMEQNDRERILIQFKNKSLDYLITTDLAARGLDILHIKHVIHYHLPAKEIEFIHRNGRTARMYDFGTAYIIIYKEDKLPDFIPHHPEILTLPLEGKLPRNPEFRTIYISGGKKNKLNKGDIVGFFIQKGKLDKNDLGLIEVKDFISFVAVRNKAVKNLLYNIKDQKMKGKKYKIEPARDILGTN